MLAQALDSGVLKVGIDAVDLARREVDPAHVGAPLGSCLAISTIFERR